MLVIRFDQEGSFVKVRDLQKINDALDRFEARADLLDPANWFETKIIDNDLKALDFYISELEASLRQRRVNNSLLKLVV